MSFSRMCFLALAIAAGFAGPASAIPLVVVFKHDNGQIPDSGRVFVQDPGYPGSIPLESFDFSIRTTSGILNFTSQNSTGVMPIFGYRDETKTSAYLANGTMTNDFGTLTFSAPTDSTWTLVAGSTTISGLYSFLALPTTTEPEPSVIPLPASAALLPLGLGGLAALRRRKKG
jgi:hypothetical protein